MNFSINFMNQSFILFTQNVNNTLVRERSKMRPQHYNNFSVIVAEKITNILNINTRVEIPKILDYIH